MKKKLVALLAVLSTVCALGACAFDGAVSFDESSSSNGGSVSESESTSDSTSDSTSESDSSSSGSETDKHLYTAFTATESALFSDTFGFVIPFAANDEYYVEDYT